MKWLITVLLLLSVSFAQYTATTVEELEYDGTSGQYMDVVAMDATHFVVLYTGGSGTDTILKSFSCDADGSNITMQDSITVNATNSSWNRIIKIDSDKVLIIITIGTTETVKTYDFDANWDATLVDSYNFPDMVAPFDLVMGTSTTDKAGVFSGNGSVGYLATIGWDDGTGDNIGQLDIAYPAADHEDSRAAAINDTLFAWVYEASGGDPWLAIVNVGVQYNDIRVASSFELYTSNYFMDVVAVDQTHALTWYVHFEKLRSFFETASFTSGSGAGAATVNAYEETTMGGYPDWQNSSGALEEHPDGDFVYFRQFAGTMNYRSYAVDGSFDITANADSTTISAVVPQGELNGGVEAALLDATTGLYVVVYCEETTLDGYLQTITVGAGGWSHSVSGVASPTKVNSAETFTKVSGVE